MGGRAQPGQQAARRNAVCASAGGTQAAALQGITQHPSVVSTRRRGVERSARQTGGAPFAVLSARCAAAGDGSVPAGNPASDQIHLNPNNPLAAKPTPPPRCRGECPVSPSPERGGWGGVGVEFLPN